MVSHVSVYSPRVYVCMSWQEYVAVPINLYLLLELTMPRERRVKSTSKKKNKEKAILKNDYNNKFTFFAVKDLTYIV